MKKRIILPGVLALSILVIALQAKNVFADDFTNYPPIVQKIADRFNLNADEVEQVFDEERDGWRAEMYARFADRLDELVNEGKLTEDQKDAILEKHEEMHDHMEELRNLPSEERRKKMRELHEGYRSWVLEQGLDEHILGGLGKGFGMGFELGFRKGLGAGYARGGD